MQQNIATIVGSHITGSQSEAIQSCNCWLQHYFHEIFGFYPSSRSAFEMSNESLGISLPAANPGAGATAQDGTDPLHDTNMGRTDESASGTNSRSPADPKRTRLDPRLAPASAFVESAPESSLWEFAFKSKLVPQDEVPDGNVRSWMREHPHYHVPFTAFFFNQDGVRNT